MTPLEQAAFLTQLIGDGGYQNLKPIRNGEYWVGTFQFMFTTAIIMGRMGDHIGYEERWCYHEYEEAVKALEAWDGEGEPEGWHRHLPSNRRRHNGIEEVVP